MSPSALPPNYEDLPYAELLPYAQAKDPLALAELWSRLLPDLLPAARVTRNEPSVRGVYDTDAMLQTGFRRFVSALPNHPFATLDDVLRFAVAILRNRRISLRQQRLTADGRQREAPLDAEGVAVPAPDEAVLATRHADLLEFLRQHLPPDIVAIVEMRADALSWREIGDLLNRNPDTLRSYFTRTIAAFQERFSAADLFP